MPVYYRDEMNTISTRQVQATMRPSVFRKLSTVRLNSGKNTVVVKLQKISGHPVIPWQTRFVCPNCGHTAKTLACIYDVWCCRNCVKWRNRGERPRTRNRAPGRPPAKRGRIEVATTEPTVADLVPKAPHLQPIDVHAGDVSADSITGRISTTASAVCSPE